MLLWIAFLAAVASAASDCCPQDPSRQLPSREEQAKICPRGTTSEPDYLFDGYHHGSDCLTFMCTAGVLTFADGDTTKTMTCENGYYMTSSRTAHERDTIYTCCLAEGEAEKSAEIEFPPPETLKKMGCDPCTANFTFDSTTWCPNGIKATNHLLATEARFRHTEKCPVLMCTQGSLSVKNKIPNSEFLRCAGHRFDTSFGAKVGSQLSGGCCIEPNHCDACKTPAVSNECPENASCDKNLLTTIPGDDEKEICQKFTCGGKQMMGRPVKAKKWYKLDRLECHDNDLVKPLWTEPIENPEPNIGFHGVIDDPYVFTCLAN